MTLSNICLHLNKRYVTWNIIFRELQLELAKQLEKRALKCIYEAAQGQNYAILESWELGERCTWRRVSQKRN